MVFPSFNFRMKETMIKRALLGGDDIVDNIIEANVISKGMLYAYDHLKTIRVF